MDDFNNINTDFDSSDLPKVSTMPKWKKYSIIAGVTASFVILLIIIIILIASSSGSTKERKAIGQIKCIYEIYNLNLATKILGDNFENQENIGIKINSKKIQFSREYKFKEDEEKEVEFEIYGPINMDYMFKNVSALTSVLMYSTSEAKIKSMTSTFENF